MVIVMSVSRGAAKRSGSTGTSTESSTPTAPVLEPLGTALDGSDPLSQFCNQNQDPLSMTADEAWDRGDSKKNKDASQEYIEPWAVRRISILNKYTTSEKLSMVSSFLSGGERVAVKSQSSVVRTRLEQLDDFEEGSVREVADLSQQEYISRIEQLNEELVQAWHQDQRVKALKIAIQCSKLLVDTSVIQFYPSKFVLVTDILDIFGKLVYDRLRTKAEYIVPGSKTTSMLPENFSPDMVSESAKETCRNWFYKIASIRELVPRLYVEAAILKSYSFLTTSEFSQALMRLTRMTRGIGDPLVAVYARCYLCRVGMSVSTVDRQFLKENFYDFLASYDQLFSTGIRMELNQQKVDLATYLSLYMPAIDWILRAVACDSSDSLLTEVLNRCKQKGNSALLLNTVMSAFKPSLIAARAHHFLELILSCSEEGFPQYLLFHTLGKCLNVCDPPSPLQLLSEVWRCITKIENPAHYIMCAEVWLQFTVTHFTCWEVNTVLGDVIRHMTTNRAYEQHYPQLQSIVQNLVTHINPFESLFTMDKFLPFLDMFRNESVKVSVCKTIMTAFCNQGQSQCPNDPVVTDALMFICRIMHDSVNALTVEDEKRQIGNLISQLLQCVQFGQDFEQQLSYYVEARASFTNLDVVHATLVQCVNRLAIETGRVVKGHHTRKTASFVRACAAYCYITIPSIGSEITRLQLYLLSAQVALANQCLGQADACLKSALSLIPDLPAGVEVDGKMRSSEPFLVSFICHLLSTLLIVPDSPDQGVMYLTRGLLNVIQHYSWEMNSISRAKVYFSVLDMLVTATQESYPYHVKKVDSNDVLYGCDQKFIAEINKMCTVVIDEILNILKALSTPDLLQKQSSVAFELFVRVVIHGDLSSPGLTTLALNLWHLANRHRLLDSRLAIRVTEYLKRRSSQQAGDNLYAELLSKVNID